MGTSRVPVPKPPEVRVTQVGPQRISNNPTLVGVHFSGPLPPPDLLRNYEEICPGCADRILKTFEGEVEHRREMERKIVDAEIAHDKRQSGEGRFGQICALTITLSALAAGAYVALQGHELAGSMIGIGGIGGIVTTFIVGRYQSSKNK